MPVKYLDHVNIRTTKLEETVRFYTEVLGLRSGDRPTTRPGAWIYDDRNTPVVHISGVDQNEHSGVGDVATLNGSGAIDHVAFEAVDYEKFQDHLARSGYEMTLREVPAFSLRQIFVHDPNGIQIELNFRSGSI